MLHLVIAVPAEARPFIEHFRMKTHEPPHPFPIFQSDQACLIVSGIGKDRAAAATGYLSAFSQKRNAAWINVGVAGHPTAPLGSLFLAHKIVDAALNRASYPQITFSPTIKTEQITTVLTSEKEYALPSLYEMEGSSFYSTALLVSSAELVHCIKVVSDNKQESLANLTPQKVCELMTSAMKPILLTIDQIVQLSEKVRHLERSPLRYEELIEKHHCSHNQKLQIKDLLSKWQVLRQKPLELDHLKTTKEVISFLKGKVLKYTLEI